MSDDDIFFKNISFENFVDEQSDKPHVLIKIEVPMDKFVRTDKEKFYEELNTIIRTVSEEYTKEEENLTKDG